MLDDEPKLAVKKRLEFEDRTGQYLVYSKAPEPLPEEDWLLNIRLCSRIFRADAVSIQLDELGLVNQIMREHLKRRNKFLRNKERVEKLKKLTAPLDDEPTLDLKMMAVLLRAEQAEPFAMLYKVFSSLVVDGEVELNEVPKGLAEIINLELEVPFWNMVREQFGYQAEDRNSNSFCAASLAVSSWSRSSGLRPTPLLPAT